MPVDHGQIVYIMGQLDFTIPQHNIQQHQDHYSNHHYESGTITLWMPHTPININLRFDSQHSCPFRSKNKDDQRWLEQQFNMLQYFNLDANTSTSTSEHACQLTDEQIQYFKTTNQSNPNVTIFIHGYNVELGNYAGAIHSKPTSPEFNKQLFPTSQQVIYAEHSYPGPIKTTENKHYQLLLSQQPATIYRDREHINHIFGINADSLHLSNDKLNSDGAHNWWVHMEYNLNKAVGFKGFHYYYQPHKPHYTRLLNITWSGNPTYSFDYMAIEPIAAISARALVTVIKQLLAAKITVNIIGHSAGCIVALKALNELGQKKHYTDAINNVFLWQAAMPDTSLSPNSERFDYSLSNYWDTGNAYKAAKKIHILYSKNDNVLGPIAVKSSGKIKAKLKDKFWSKSGDFKMASMAVIIHTLDQVDKASGIPNSISSAYHTAQLFNLPLTSLFVSKEIREKAYLLWRNKHYQENATLAPTIEEQKNAIKKKFPIAFNNISLIITLYYAVLHDSLLRFLADPKNQEKISTMLLHLSPKQSSIIINSTMEAMNSIIDVDTHQLVINKLHEFSRDNLHFDYIYKLFHLLIYRDAHYAATKITNISTHLFSKLCDFLLHIPESFIKNTTQINQALYEKLTNKNTVKNKTTEHAAIITGEEIAALIITVFSTPNIKLRPAMGYSGPLRSKHDRAMERLIKQGKITIVDQTEYLFQHSGMRVPSDELFKKVYQDVIANEPTYQLGLWESP